jgi:hypothetical protein
MNMTMIDWGILRNIQKMHFPPMYESKIDDWNFCVPPLVTVDTIGLLKEFNFYAQQYKFGLVFGINEFWDGSLYRLTKIWLTFLPLKG